MVDPAPVEAARPPAPHQPLVVAHRGASHDTAEHTLLAYQRALDAGADGLECDVRLTADGHLVCVHDRDLRRTTSRRGLVSTMDLAELDQLDFASWKNPWADLDDEAEEPDPEHARLLTLRRLLEAVVDQGRRVELAIETKHPTRYAGLVERRLAQLLADFGWTSADSPVRMMSFSWTALRRMRRLAPGLRLVMLMDSRSDWARLRSVVDRDWILGPGIELLRDNPRLARRMAASGHELNVWTVNTPEELDTCLGLGVSAVISDRPAYLLDLLGR